MVLAEDDFHDQCYVPCLDPTFARRSGMCSKKFSLSSALAFHAELYSKSMKRIIVALILLSAVSNGQGIPASLALQNESGSSITALPSNGLKEYIIYSFIEGASQDADNSKIRLHLGMILAPTEVNEYGGDHTGVEFWHVVMTDIQRTAFRSAIPRVSFNGDKEEFWL